MMKKLLIISGVLLAIIVVAALVIYFAFPRTILRVANAKLASDAGVELREVAIDGYQAHFYASTDPKHSETIVFVHGLGDQKSSFLQVAIPLSERYNLLLPDLLGHGDNAKETDRNYSIRAQADFLKRLLAKLKVGPVHLVGNSMGGHTSASFAIHYPEMVSTLTLVNAAGVKLDDHVVYTGYDGPLENDAELQKSMERVFYKTPPIPGRIRDVIREDLNDGRAFSNETLIPQITSGEDFDLKDRVNEIKAPTLVLWGKHDRIVPNRVGEIFCRKHPARSSRVAGECWPRPSDGDS